MDMRALLAPDAGYALGQSRARVLDLLRAASSPLKVQEIASQAGLHPNTARFHLDRLVEAGLAIREPQPQPQARPGRPSMVYRGADGGNPAGRRRYRLLAQMLASLITGVMPEAGKAATEAGREWGAFFTEQPPPFQRPGPEETIGRLAAIMEQLGFAPQAAADGARYRLGLHKCPFREVAEENRDVVCSLHLGLMQGALAQMRAPVTADRLEPFAEPSLCVAYLTVREGLDASQPPGGAG